MVALMNGRINLRGLGFWLQDAQHSIRRIEFDDWLLKRSGARVARRPRSAPHRASSVRRSRVALGA